MDGGAYSFLLSSICLLVLVNVSMWDWNFTSILDFYCCKMPSIAVFVASLLMLVASAIGIGIFTLPPVPFHESIAGGIAGFLAIAPFALIFPSELCPNTINAAYAKYLMMLGVWFGIDAIPTIISISTFAAYALATAKELKIKEIPLCSCMSIGAVGAILRGLLI